MAEMNVMLEEAASKTSELSVEADQTTHAIDQMLRRAKEAGDRIAAESERNHALLEALTGKFEQMRHDLTNKAGTTKTHIEGLKSKANEVHKHVGDFLTNVKHALDDLTQHKQEVHSHIDSESHAKESQVQTWIGKILHLEESTNSHHEQTTTHLNEHHQKLEHARTAVQDSQHQFDGHTEQLHSHAQEKHNDLLQAFQGFISTGEHKVEETVNGLVHKGEETLGHLTQQFGGDAVQKLLENVPGLSDPMEALGKVAHGFQETFGDKFQAVTDKISGITDIVDKIKPVADTIKAVLG